MFSSIARATARAAIARPSASTFNVLKASTMPVFSSSIYRTFSSAPAKLTVQEIEDRVLELLKNFSKTKQDKLTIDAHFVNDLGLDSLDQVEITMELEDEFNIELTDNVAEKIFTVKDAVEAVIHTSITTYFPDLCG